MLILTPISRGEAVYRLVVIKPSTPVFAYNSAAGSEAEQFYNNIRWRYYIVCFEGLSRILECKRAGQGFGHVACTGIFP